ncbi:hypothetical protein [Sorangium sp. So ce854]|uniref:hypothetical protein n=1 Tax=Sorangium sp. So ce854 TaxID=3133322 RepID=UPI003F61A5FD
MKSSTPKTRISSLRKRKRTSGKQGNVSLAIGNSTGRSRKTTAVNAVTKRRRLSEPDADSSSSAEIASQDASDPGSSDSDDEEGSQRSRIDSGLVRKYNDEEDQEDQGESDQEEEEEDGDDEEEEDGDDEEEGDGDDEEEEDGDDEEEGDGDDEEEGDGDDEEEADRTSTRQELDDMAERLNLAIHGDGRFESRNVQAVVQTDDGTYIIFTQREYNAFDEAIQGIEARHGITIDDRVIGDNPREDENIHAEMLAVSWWLQGRIGDFNRIGVSRAVCARCAAVLAHYGIQHRPTDGAMTQNWVHPYRHADLDPDEMPAALRAIPQKVTKNREYGW